MRTRTMLKNKFRAIKNFDYLNQINIYFPNIEIDQNIKKLDKDVWINDGGELIVLDDLNKLLSNKTDLEENILDKFVIIIQINSGIAALELGQNPTPDVLKNSTNLIAVGKVKKVSEWRSYTKNELLLQIEFLEGFSLGKDLKGVGITSWVLNQGTSEIIEIMEKDYLELKVASKNNELIGKLISYNFQTQKNCELTDVEEINEAN